MKELDWFYNMYDEIVLQEIEWIDYRLVFEAHDVSEARTTIAEVSFAPKNWIVV